MPADSARWAQQDRFGCDNLQAAQLLVGGHLDQVGQMPLASLCRACGLDRDLVSAALDLIRGWSLDLLSVFRPNEMRA